ncbi:MAG: glycosyltransferase family 10 [Bacteroidota bacterium]
MSPLRQYLTTPLRQWLEDRRTIRRGQNQLKAHGQAYYGFWSLGPMQERWFFRFLQRPAFDDLLHEKQVQFFSVFGRRRLLRYAKPHPPRVFFTGEHLANYPTWADHALEAVDLALGFDSLNHERYLRFPLWLLDIFPPEADLDAIQKRLSALQAAANNFTNRECFAALIARHDNNGIRGKMADLTTNYGRVDFPGLFRNSMQPILAPGYVHKLALLHKYKFNLCPENTDAPGYVTEKLWHAIAAGCIPIYWGAGNQPEVDILRQQAILFFQPDEPQALAEQLETLLASPAKLQAFATQEKFQPDAAEKIHAYFLRLEHKLLEVLS